MQTPQHLFVSLGMKLVFFLHHKAASSWATGIAKVITFKSGLIFSLNSYSGDIAVFPLATPEIATQLPSGALGVHLIRDPRDIVVSGYYSHMNTHKIRTWHELQVHRDALKAESNQSRRLMLEMDFSERFISPMLEWNYDNPNILEWKYEEVCFESTPYFVHAFERANLLTTSRIQCRLKQYLNRAWRRVCGKSIFKSRIILKSDLIAKVESRSFKNITGGRVPGDKDYTSHYRRGKPGEWREYFDEDVSEYFAKKFPSIIKNLGYNEK